MTSLDSSAEAFQTEVELVNRILAGERRAEEELVGRYKRGVSIVVRHIVKDHFAHEDICQDTFRLVLEKIRRGDLREPARLSGFICSLARNLSLEHLRSARPMEVLEETEHSASFPDSKPDQLNLILKDEEAKAIRQMLQELSSDRDRAVLYRYYFADEEKDRICADLGLSSVHFNQVLSRARRRFKELYEKKTRK